MTKLDDTAVLTKFNKRFNDMDSQRSKFTGERLVDEVSFDAPVITDEDGNFLANDKTEQSLLRFEL